MKQNHYPLLEGRIFVETAKDILNEEFSYESFISWAARKLKGVSIKEIDHLAKRVSNIDTHEEKIDCIDRIKDAIKAATEKYDAKKKEDAEKKDDPVHKNEVEYLEEHLSILKALLSKAQSFNIIAHIEAKKNEGRPQSSGENGDRKTFHIDSNT